MKHQQRDKITTKSQQNHKNSSKLSSNAPEQESQKKTKKQNKTKIY
jgi:hypothetical protein